MGVKIGKILKLYQSVSILAIKNKGHSPAKPDENKLRIRAYILTKRFKCPIFDLALFEWL